MGLIACCEEAEEERQFRSGAVLFLEKAVRRSLVQTKKLVFLQIDLEESFVETKTSIEAPT